MCIQCMKYTKLYTVACMSQLSLNVHDTHTRTIILKLELNNAIPESHADINAFYYLATYNYRIS